ncbi:MAG: HD-GYP domain-containing protein [Longimicrobiales bacterium]
MGTGARTPIDTLLEQGRVAERTGDWRAAERVYRAARAQAQRAGDQQTTAEVEQNLGVIASIRGDIPSALMSYTAALFRYRLLNDRGAATRALARMGIAHVDLDEPDAADACFEQARQLARHTGDVLLQADLEHELARTYLDRDDSRSAIVHLNRAHALCLEIEPRTDTVNALLARIDAVYLCAVEQWAGEVLRASDPYTLGHCTRVAACTERLARAVGIAGRELHWLRIGAFLHDIGKSVIPRAVLEKPAALDDEERRLVRQHTVRGAEIVMELALPFDVIPMVRYHHERWDGRGYPAALAGSDIPFHARILAVADVYDALTTARTYSAPCDAACACGVLDHEAGRALDPVLVATFQRAVARAH